MSARWPTPPGAIGPAAAPGAICAPPGAILPDNSAAGVCFHAWAFPSHTNPRRADFLGHGADHFLEKTQAPLAAAAIGIAALIGEGGQETRAQIAMGEMQYQPFKPGRQGAARGIGILITDHNVRETLGVCDRSCIIADGTVIAAGPAAEILANPRVREVYLGDTFRL